MEQQLSLDELKEHALSHQLRATNSAIRNHWRLVWTVCASLSLMSGRYLLVELNLHFPLHLNLIHLLAAAAWTMHWSGWRKREHIPREHSEQLSMRAWILSTVLASLMSVSMLLSTQAILHTHNLPTLPMLIAIAFFVDDLMIFIAGHVTRSETQILRLLLLMAACGGILIGEYRLLVPALLTCIPAMVLAGAARGVRYIAEMYYFSALANRRRMTTLFYLTGAITTTAAILLRFDESPFELASTLRVRHIPLLVLNALSTAIAINLGKSVVFPFPNTEKNIVTESSTVQRLRDTLTLVALTGITGCWCSLILRRSYTTSFQFLMFSLAAACVSVNAVICVFRRGHPSASETRATYTVLPALHSSEEGDCAFSDTTEDTIVEEVDGGRRNTLISVLLGGMILVVPWVGYLALNFSDRVHVEVDRAEPILDNKYTPSIPLDIVISMYKESVEDVSDLINKLKQIPHLSKARVKIYSKDAEADNIYIQQYTKADNVTTIPNIGREGETYLHHILDHWDNLAKHTVFLQADVHNPREFYPRIRDYYDPERTGMLSLGLDTPVIATTVETDLVSGIPQICSSRPTAVLTTHSPAIRSF